MSRFTVNLQDPPPQEPNAAGAAVLNGQGAGAAPKAAVSTFGRVLKGIGIFLLIAILAGGIGGFLYWQGVKKTPQYSLALLVDAARRDDKAQIERLVDTETVVENFMPQVSAKAIELYGRNLPPQTIAKVEQAAAPALPVIKERAKTELPRVIREKTAAAEKAPYWLIALFADRAVEITTEGETAQVKSKLADRPLELTMKRNPDGTWKVVAMKDDVLARKIAEKIGQDIIAAAAKGGLKKAVEQLGVHDLDVLRNAEDIFK